MSLTFRELGPGDYLKAFGLARLSREIASEAGWFAELARHQLDKNNPGGVICFENDAGYLMALLYYKVTYDGDMRCLCVGDFIVPEMLKPLLRNQFQNILDSIASEKDCVKVELSRCFKDSPDALFLPIDGDSVCQLS